jgi:4'-phosphopantetheinyl transferase
MATPSPSQVLQLLTTDEWMRRGTASVDLLGEPERARARRFRRETDRRDYIAAHLLAREVVAGLLGVAAADVRLTQFCPRCRVDGHGPPRVTVPGSPPVFTSWSHSSGRIGAVAAYGPVGFDLERAEGSADLTATIAGQVLSAGEQAQVRDAAEPRIALLHWWTRKEALVKVGAVELDDFGVVDLSVHAGRWGSWRTTSWHDDARGVVAATATAAPTP